MIQIDKEYNGFSVKVKEPGFGRFAASAASIAEVQECIEHYYGGKKSAPHLGERESCPFCRRSAAIAKKEARKNRLAVGSR